MIRQYKDSDVDAVVATWRNASELAHPFLSSEFLDQEEKNVRDVYPKFAEIWVKETNSQEANAQETSAQVIGFIALIGNEVGAIFLSPDHHGQGIGRELMDYAVSIKGDITVDVFKQNEIGRRFYDGYGFKAIREYVHEPSRQVTIQMAFKFTK